jgi:hypothetical protein
MTQEHLTLNQVTLLKGESKIIRTNKIQIF